MICTKKNSTQMYVNYMFKQECEQMPQYCDSLLNFTIKSQNPTLLIFGVATIANWTYWTDDEATVFAAIIAGGMATYHEMEIINNVEYESENLLAK